MGTWMAGEGDRDDERQIGDRISARMSEIGVGLPALAKTLGVTEDTIYKLVRGKTAKRWVDLIKLARALRTSPNDLLGYDAGDTRKRLERLLGAAFQGLGASPVQAQNYAEIFLEALDRPPNPQEPVGEADQTRIELAAAKRRFERQ